MKKNDYIAKYGKAAYEKVKRQGREWHAAHPGRMQIARRKQHRKGSEYYEQYLANSKIGLRGERNKIRMRDRSKWRLYKRIIAPDSQLHHSWCRDSAEYTGLALVEADQHIHGMINVIRILEGKITLFTEEEVRNRVN